VLKTIAPTIIPQKKTPPLDKIKKRKRNSNEVNETDAIMQQSFKNISSLACTLETVLQGQISTPKTSQQLTLPETPLAIQNMTGSIILGLSKVPEEHHMDCLIRVLSCINEFAKKKLHVFYI